MLFSLDETFPPNGGNISTSSWSQRLDDEANFDIKKGWKNHSKLTQYNGKLVLWGPVVWIPRIPLVIKRECYFGLFVESQTTNLPSVKLTSFWPTLNILTPQRPGYF